MHAEPAVMSSRTNLIRLLFVLFFSDATRVASSLDESAQAFDQQVDPIKGYVGETTSIPSVFIQPDTTLVLPDNHHNISTDRQCILLFERFFVTKDGDFVITVTKKGDAGKYFSYWQGGHQTFTLIVNTRSGISPYHQATIVLSLLLALIVSIFLVYLFKLARTRRKMQF